MTEETEKELADRLDAEDRLVNRGYEKKTCGTCDGLGILRGGQLGVCYSCKGRGFHWYAPLVKTKAALQ